MTVGWALVIVVAIFVFLLMRSPWGRVLKSIREDEDAARSLGKNVFSYKMQTLVLGGVIGALGGFMIAVSTQSVQPDNFATPLTFFILTALLLGGAARVIGPIVGVDAVLDGAGVHRHVPAPGRRRTTSCPTRS